MGIIHLAGREQPTCCAPHLNMRFPTLYTFPPLYTQKPAARRVFVYRGDFLLWESMPEKKKATFRGDRYEKWFYERKTLFAGSEMGHRQPKHQCDADGQRDGDFKRGDAVGKGQFVTALNKIVGGVVDAGTGHEGEDTGQ